MNGPDSSDQTTRFEKIPVEIFHDSSEASKMVAFEIASLVKLKQANGKNFVLSLATGSTPTSMYDELIRLHRQEGLSFKNVITFNLDEYYPIQPNSLQSYMRFMKENLFDHIDIDPANIHIPDGTLPIEKVTEFCQEYERKIEAVGGIDLQVLGIGRTGHIGFNEPGSSANSLTRLITLDHITRTDAASDFFGDENVPRRAITMGIGTIRKAKKIILMAWGEGKANIIKATIEGNVSEMVPATYLQQHPDAKIVLDNASSSELTRVKTPWLVVTCRWDDQLIRRAVVWLCQKVNKPVLKLTDRDYTEHGMDDLITEQGPAQLINIKVFNDLQHTISGWPGGKPNADDTYRPERADPFPKRVIIFSPHPDDDVISMGGTFLRLVEQGHEVHLAYQTSGNIAVFDDDAIRFVDFVRDFNEIFHLQNKDTDVIFSQVNGFLKVKAAGEVDLPQLQKIKGVIRRGEAKAACRFFGVKDENIHFLDMPFYETGLVKKKPLSDKDIQIIADLIEEIRPHQIYAAGDLSDPHGTHRVCLTAIYRAIDQLKKEPWLKDCYVWLYRGAWQEWDLDQIEMAVPISPDELLKKRKAIFKHQSQKDRPLFPGPDHREFWQRAEERNRTTAKMYDALGLAEYEAIEAFRRHHF